MSKAAAKRVRKALAEQQSEQSYVGMTINQLRRNVERWLEDIPRHCPHIPCDVCATWFPNAKQTPCDCPCNAFNPKYVTKRVKETLPFLKGE